MPLPDERPRQSVANLIGRFEQKRQSMTGVVPPQLPIGFPRSTSVVSHITGDSAKEETIQKREWPPKSTATDEKPSSILVSPVSQPKSPPVIEAGPAKSSAAEVVPQPTAEPTKTPRPSTANTKSPPVRKATSTPAKGPAPRTSAAAKTPPKSQIRSPPQNSPLNPPKSQPLRPQHTGTSTKSAGPTSTFSGIKQSKSSFKTTPNRPKTPSSTTTPDAHSKTPSGTTSRPKTPSSGLFAPTAASLAKARNAAPPLPTPVKRATLSSSAAERLSKPTAASISKARSPTMSPAVRTAKTSASASSSQARGAAGAAKATMKPRVGLAPARMKEAAAAKNEIGNGATKEAVAAATVAVTPPAIEGEIAVVYDDESEAIEHHDDSPAANGHSLESSGYLHESHGDESFAEHVEEPEEIALGLEVEGVSHEVEPENHEEVAENAEIEGLPIVVSPDLPSSYFPEGLPHELELETEPDIDVGVEVQEALIAAVAPVVPSEEPQRDDAVVSSPHPAPAEEAEEAHVEHVEDVTEPPAQAGHDIDDIVNVLETVPTIPVSQPRPLSIAHIPDDAPDIPDEE